MPLKTYRAFTLAEAVEAVRSDLGSDAVILHTRTYKRGGLLGLGRRNVVEVIASDAEPATDSAIDSPAADLADPSHTPGKATPQGVAAERVYRSGSLMVDSNRKDTRDLPDSERNLEIDQARTRRLAQAMHVRLEREANARQDSRKPAPEEPTPDVPADPGTPRRFVIGPDGELMPEYAVVPPAPLEVEKASEVDDDLTSEREPRGEAAAAPLGSGNELDAIRSMVGRVIDQQGSSSAPAVQRAPGDESDPLVATYTDLIAQELSRELADNVVQDLARSMTPEVLGNPRLVRDAVLERIASLVPTAESTQGSEAADGRPWTQAFVGPTGVGKTTTLAKVASTMSLREGRRVGLLTADTYRVAAVDQLRTYADILQLPLAVAHGPSEMQEALDSLKDCDAVLIDTPGRSQNDLERLADLRSIIDVAQPHEVHLVLSGTAGERVLLREAEAFAPLRPDRIVLTKLDEAVSFGMLVSVVRQIGRRISWVTTGQEVPSDIERATGRRIAGMMLGQSVKS
ncbi:MAG: flagellar biosynthesis protein FlhF [Phycisphaerales bacterium]|nr:flagellar biosynthesis protein FlhF [Phycisphaerales bacterium]